MPEHQLEYELAITFHKDGVKIISTGEGLQVKTISPESIVRHRHTKLVNQVNDIIRQYIKDNQ